MKGGEGGVWIFELNEIWVELKTETFQNQGGGEKEGQGGVFEIFIGGKIGGDET